HLWTVLVHEGEQLTAAGAQLLLAQLVGSGGGPGDQVGQPDPALAQVGPVLGGHPRAGVDRARDDAGAQQRGVEAVARVREVRPGGGGPQPGVDADEEQAEPGADHVGDGAVAEGLQLGSGESHAVTLRMRRRCAQRHVGCNSVSRTLLSWTWMTSSRLTWPNSAAAPSCSHVCACWTRRATATPC